MKKLEIVIQKELSPVAKKALALEIKTAEDMPEAVELLSRLNKFNDRIIEEREKITKPLNEALKVERARWKPIELENQGAIDTVRAKMTVYQTAVVAKQKAEELKLSTKMADGKISPKLADKKFGEIVKAEKEVATPVGLVQFRETQILKVTNEKLIPREYLEINEKKVLDALKDGKVVAGAEIEIIQTPINYR